VREPHVPIGLLGPLEEPVGPLVLDERVRQPGKVRAYRERTAAR